MIEIIQKQIVAGTNYKIIARDTASTKEPADIKEVIIYENQEGECYILSIEDYKPEEVLV